MSNVIGLPPRLVGDGIKIDADDMLRANIGVFRAVVLVGEDKDGKLICASTDGRSDAIALLSRAKAKIIAGFED